MQTFNSSRSKLAFKPNKTGAQSAPPKTHVTATRRRVSPVTLVSQHHAFDESDGGALRSQNGLLQSRWSPIPGKMTVSSEGRAQEAYFNQRQWEGASHNGGHTVDIPSWSTHNYSSMSLLHNDFINGIVTSTEHQGLLRQANLDADREIHDASEEVFVPEKVSASSGKSQHPQIPSGDDVLEIAAQESSPLQENSPRTIVSVDLNGDVEKGLAAIETPALPLRITSSEGKESALGCDTSSAVKAATPTAPINKAEGSAEDETVGKGVGSRRTAETGLPNSLQYFAPTGCAIEASTGAGDFSKSDTHGVIIKARRGNGSVSTSLGGGAAVRIGSMVREQSEMDKGNKIDGNEMEANPLDPTQFLGATGEGRPVDAHYSITFPFGSGSSTEHYITERIDAEEFGHGNRNAVKLDYDDSDGVQNGDLLTGQKGEQEWLRVPSLFYLFATMIKWNELLLQHQASGMTLQNAANHVADSSPSLTPSWTQIREKELHTLESRIHFSVCELDDVYLNPLLVRWSKPEVRALVAEVASAWKKGGPNSPALASVSSRLFDAISMDQSCLLRSTCLYRARHWIGSAQHRWNVTCFLTALFVTSILCIVFSAVFGRHNTSVCIALSLILGVAVVLMHITAMLILHHNTCADAAARHFREDAVRFAQQKMEEEEREEEDYDDNVDLYRSALRVSRNSSATYEGCLPVTESDAGADNGYVQDEVSLAVSNLRALTEGEAPRSSDGSPRRLSDPDEDGKHGGGVAVSGFKDEMRLTDENCNSLTNHFSQDGNAIQKRLDTNCNESVCKKFASGQFQPDLGQNHLVASNGFGLPHQCSDTNGVVSRLPRGAVLGSSEKYDRNGSTKKSSADAKETMFEEQHLAPLSQSTSVTALLFCRDTTLLYQVASSLWDYNFMILRIHDLEMLDSELTRGTEHAKVILIHAPDAPEGSRSLHTALSWLQEKCHPVFFFARSSASCAVSVPTSTRIQVPFSPAVLNTLLFSGLGVKPEQANTSFSTILPGGQEQRQRRSSTKQFQVPPYTLGRRLGGGAYGNVFEAEMESTAAKCAVKRIYLKENPDNDDQLQSNSNAGAVTREGPSNTVSGTSAAAAEGQVTTIQGSGVTTEAAESSTIADSQLREIAQEVGILSSLQHPNIVQFYFCERDDNCISIFMELCTGGSLGSLIHSGKLVNPPEIKLLLREIIGAVTYLHSKRIVHRDLKPDNILFRHGHIKITDFGSAVHKHGGDLRLIKGTFAYMAPEILVGDPYGRACDVWSIGCIAAEVLSVELPQHALGLPEMCDYYRAMGEDSTLPIECDVPGVRDFLLACLQRDPKARSTAAELCNHPVLQFSDSSIHTWMEEVVAERRRTHQQTFYRGGLGGRGGSNASGTTTYPVGGSNAPNSFASGGNMNLGDSFDLHSGVGSALSSDSTRLLHSSATDGKQSI